MTGSVQAWRKTSQMNRHVASINWQREGQVFTDRRYSRAHSWSFDGGLVVGASSSPHSVRLPFSDPAGIDPEEAMIASLSSCHMLWFLDLAAQAGLVVDSYIDEAEGEMDKTGSGHSWLARVTLKPVTTFSGRRPGQDELEALHHEAHVHCDMARTVRSEIRVIAGLGPA